MLPLGSDVVVMRGPGKPLLEVPPCQLARLRLALKFAWTSHTFNERPTEASIPADAVHQGFAKMFTFPCAHADSFA